MRAVDADKLKRRAQRVATEAWKMKLIAPIETTLNQFIDWINEAPTIQAEPCWIPVTERLPDNSRNVLITHKGGVSMAWYNGLYFERGASTHHQKIKTVMAWRELPEPYQKGDAE